MYVSQRKTFFRKHHEIREPVVIGRHETLCIVTS